MIKPINYCNLNDFISDRAQELNLWGADLVNRSLLNSIGSSVHQIQHFCSVLKLSEMDAKIFQYLWKKDKCESASARVVKK